MITEKERMKNRIVEETYEILELEKVKLMLEVKSEFTSHVEREYVADTIYNLGLIISFKKNSLESLYKDYEEEYL